MSQEQISKTSQEVEETVETVPTENSAQELIDETDDLLDEIDSVLEENAEEFVAGYIQKGGQ